jgi:hypothetical protein
VTRVVTLTIELVEIGMLVRDGLDDVEDKVVDVNAAIVVKRG